MVDPGASPQSWPREMRAASSQSRLQAGRLSLSTWLAAASQWLTFIFKREMVSSSFFFLLIKVKKEFIMETLDVSVFLY